MNKSHDSGTEERLNSVLIESLEQSIEHLDAHTLSRLNQARHSALAQAQRPHPAASQWLKAGAFAVLLAAVINGWMLFSTPDVQQPNTDVLEMVIANDDFELLQDLDFVAWMIEEDHAG